MKKIFLGLICFLFSGFIFALPQNAINSPSLSNISVANNSTIVTNGSGVGSLSTTLPSAVQANITSVGTIASGTWNGSTISTAKGGTGITASPSHGSLLVGISGGGWGVGGLDSPGGTIDFGISGLGTIHADVDTSALTDVLHTAGNETASGIKNFTGTFVFSKGEAVYSSTSTISASDLRDKIITSSSSITPIVLTLPTGSDFDTALGSPAVGATIPVLFINFGTGTGTVTLANNSGFTLGGTNLSVIGVGLAGRFFWARKSAATPAYILYG